MIPIEHFKKYHRRSNIIAVRHSCEAVRNPTDHIIRFPDIEDDKFSLPSWKELMKLKVIVCSCADANILVAAQCSNSSLARLEAEIMTSLHPHRAAGVVQPHWTHLLIDEAAQGSEPELLIPISVVADTLQVLPPVRQDIGSVFVPQLVLCGDPKQRAFWPCI